MWGPCFGHKRAMFWPFLGKEATGYTQQCGIWHGTSLGTLSKIQEEPIIRTMRGPCLGHKRATFWQFLAKWATGFTQQSDIWHWVSLGTLIKIQDKPIWGTMWGLCLGHKRVIFWPFLGSLIYWLVKLKTRHSLKPLVLFYHYLYSMVGFGFLCLVWHLCLVRWRVEYQYLSKQILKL